MLSRRQLQGFVIVGNFIKNVLREPLGYSQGWRKDRHDDISFSEHHHGSRRTARVCPNIILIADEGKTPLNFVLTKRVMEGQRLTTKNVLRVLGPLPDIYLYRCLTPLFYGINVKRNYLRQAPLLIS